ncbi:MAG: hypothetical protein ACJ77K_06980 [Bacteroidia bacterium]
MKKKTDRSKVISFLGMMLSMMLLIVLMLLYFQVREAIGFRENIFFGFAMLFSICLFISSVILSLRHKWGDKNSFTPMV